MCSGSLSLGSISALAIYCLMTGSSLQGCVTAYSDIHRTLGVASSLLQSLSSSSYPSLASSPLQSSLSAEKKKKASMEARKENEAEEEEVSSLKISGGSDKNSRLTAQPLCREESREDDFRLSSSSFSTRERAPFEMIRDSLSSSLSLDEDREEMKAHGDAALCSQGREKKNTMSSKETKVLLGISPPPFARDKAGGYSSSILSEPRRREEKTDGREEEEERRGVDVVFRNVWFSYFDQNSPWSLRDVSLHIPHGSRWAILGRLKTHALTYL